MYLSTRDIEGASPKRLNEIKGKRRFNLFEGLNKDYASQDSISPA